MIEQELVETIVRKVAEEFPSATREQVISLTVVVAEEVLKKVREDDREGVADKAPESYLTIPAPNMESTTCHESVGEKGCKGLDKKCRIHVHSRTHRLADPDGRSSKAAIDGLREAGVFPDDSPKFVSEVQHSQEAIKSNESEETIIDIYWE